MAEYIDREALYEKAYWHGEHPDVENPFPDGVDAVDIKDVDAIPAADVAPVRHGRWEKWNGDDRHHCTVCECYANAERDSYGYIAYEFLDNYCPNCGSKMDLEEPNEAKESRQP